MYSLELKVAVSTKSPKSDKQYVWEGEANSSSYIIREETDPENLLPRGTRLTLYLKVSDSCLYHWHAQVHVIFSRLAFLRVLVFYLEARVSFSSSDPQSFHCCLPSLSKDNLLRVLCSSPLHL